MGDNSQPREGKRIDGGNRLTTELMKEARVDRNPRTFRARKANTEGKKGEAGKKEKERRPGLE